MTAFVAKLRLHIHRSPCAVWSSAAQYRWGSERGETQPTLDDIEACSFRMRCLLNLCVDVKCGFQCTGGQHPGDGRPTLEAIKALYFTRCILDREVKMIHTQCTGGQHNGETSGPLWTTSRPSTSRHAAFLILPSKTELDLHCTGGQHNRRPAAHPGGHQGPLLHDALPQRVDAAVPAAAGAHPARPGRRRRRRLQG